MRKKLLRIIAAALLLLLLPVLALAAEFAVVTGGKLNLRQYASTDSYSLGKYASGSWVEIKGDGGNGFAYVKTMDGKKGYMSTNYLATAAEPNVATVRYANGGYVNLRSGPALTYSVLMRITSGTKVTIENDSYEWNYVSVFHGGQIVCGYMHDSFLDKAAGTAVVSTRNGGKVNVRSGPSGDYDSIGKLASGTTMTVLLKGNGWYYISANGITGFMSTQYISGSGSTVGSNTGSSSSGSSSGVTNVSIAYVNNPKSTQVLNLREYASTDARSIGQYRNGTQVRVVAYGKTWCEVYVGTKHGYMMTRYLSFDGSYIQPTYTSTPAYTYPGNQGQHNYPYLPNFPNFPYFPGYPAATPSPTPTPLIQYITPRPKATATPQVTMQPSYNVANTPHAGMYAWLAIAAGSSSSSINVYSNPELTQYKATYQPGQQVMVLSYGRNVSLILVGGEAAYVSTWHLNY